MYFIVLFCVCSVVTILEASDMEILNVQNLCKSYDKFKLDNISFSLEEGYIMGFIGRNGAGKTTTLKSMLGLVHPDSGSVRMLGHDTVSDELFFRQNTGVVFGEFDFYKKKKLSAITSVVSRFYSDWDDAVYRKYLDNFALDPEKRIDELSAGMKLKYSLTLALSHNARLLILDEPTSGLDPVSRDELLSIFREIIEDGDKSILFSTHITSDLDKCADYIAYIKDGRLITYSDRQSYTDSYRLVSGRKAVLNDSLKQILVGYRENAFGFTGLIKADSIPAIAGLEYAPADLESIMIYREKENNI